MIEIVEVKTKKQRREFVNFLYELYKGNKYWCPPIRASEMDAITPNKVSASRFCDTIWFLAYKDGKVAGRIGGIISNKSNEVWNEKKVRFTRFDFIDDLEVSGALLKAVEDWGKANGNDECHGPMGYTDLDQEGMLIEGFDEMSTFVTLYNFSYYVTHMEHHGYGKDTDWMEYRIKVPTEPDSKVERVAQMVSKKRGYKLIEFTRTKDIIPYANDLFAVWNDAYKVLFGAVALDQEMIDEVVKEFISLVNPEFIKLVEDKNGKIVAFGICFPSLTKACQKSNGHLYPFGILHLLRALKKNDTLDMYLVGVLPELQGKGINALLMDSIIKTAIKYDMKYAESNPELEDNVKIQSSWRNFERRQHRRRRCWVKTI